MISFLAEHSKTSSPLIAIAPFAPLVITIFFFKFFEKSTTSLNDELFIKDKISCSFANTISSLFLTNSKNCFLCLSTQNKSDKDIATLFELFIALSNALLGSPSSQRYPSKNVISAFLISLTLISLSFIFPAVPKKVHIVLSESGVINIKQLPVGISSLFFEYKYFTFSFLKPSSYF